MCVYLFIMLILRFEILYLNLKQNIKPNCIVGSAPLGTSWRGKCIVAAAMPSASAAASGAATAGVASSHLRALWFF